MTKVVLSLTSARPSYSPEGNWLVTSRGLVSKGRYRPMTQRRIQVGRAIKGKKFWKVTDHRPIIRPYFIPLILKLIKVLLRLCLIVYSPLRVQPHVRFAGQHAENIMLQFGWWTTYWCGCLQWYCRSGVSVWLITTGTMHCSTNLYMLSSPGQAFWKYARHLLFCWPHNSDYYLIWMESPYRHNYIL